jgi:phosphoesterase RecJ-like protein
MTSVVAVRNALLASRRAVITTHLNADGDGAGSEGAMVSWLRAQGCEAWIVNPTPFPDVFRFVIEDEDWIVPAGSRQARNLCDSADLAVVLDTGEVTRIGRVRDLIRELPTVVIDHHPPGDRPIGGTSLRDASASATGELVYDVLLAADGPWTEWALQGLYVAILTDTGSFRFANSSPGSHRVAAELISQGVNPEEMYSKVYGAAPIRKFKLLERALATLDVDAEGGVAWMIVPTEAFEELNVTPDDLEGLVDVPRGIEGAQVGLLFRQTNTGEVKISLRSNGPVDVNELARRFGGGGHVRASGAIVAGPLERAVDEVLGAVRQAVAETRTEGATD